MSGSVKALGANHFCMAPGPESPTRMRFAIADHIPTLEPRNLAAFTADNLQQLLRVYENTMYKSD